MQFIPRRTVTLDVSLPQVTICHEHELGCCRIPAVYSLSLAPSWVLQQLLPSQGPKSFFHPLKSIVRLVPSLLRPVCSYHVPKKASSCFKVNSSHYSGGHLIMCRKSVTYLLSILPSVFSSRSQFLVEKEWKEGENLIGHTSGLPLLPGLSFPVFYPEIWSR